MKAIVEFAIEKAAEGVEYSPRYGAICPFCGAIWMPSYKCKPWDDNTRVRYHKCKNKDCQLHINDISIKSVQVDRSGVKLPAIEIESDGYVYSCV